MSIRDLYKAVWPDASDEAIDRDIAGVQSAPSEAMKKVLSFIPGLGAAYSATPDSVKDSIGQGVNGLASSNTVQDASKAILDGQGGNPLSSLAQGATQGLTKDILRPSEPELDEGPGPSEENKLAGAELPPLETPSQPKETAPKQPTAPVSGAGKGEASPESLLAQAKASQNQDNEARKAMLEEEHKKRMLGGIASLGAGIGDAITNASTAFGGSAHSNAQANVEKTLNDKMTANKAEFEENLKNDPNSGLSKNYQQVLAMMLGKKADDPSVTGLSATQIGQTLPEVEKFMQKKLQMEQIKATKELAQQNRSMALSEKEDQFNQRRWERFGAAINPLNAGSRKALGIAASNNMRADRLLATAQNRTITSQDYSNLIADLQGIYKGGVPDQVMMGHGDYPSLQRKAGQILSLLSGKPSAVHTPEVLSHLTELTRELKDVDNKVINDNLGINSIIFDELQKADPQKFERVLDALANTTVGVADNLKSPASSSGSRPSLTSFYRR